MDQNIPWVCPVASQECAIRRKCTNKCGASHLGNPPTKEQVFKLKWTDGHIFKPPVTAANLTDSQILAFGRSKRDGTASDAIWREHCARALGITLASDEFVAMSRKILAQAINRTGA